MRDNRLPPSLHFKANSVPHRHPTTRAHHTTLCTPGQVFLTASFVVLVLEYAAGGHLGRLVPAGCGLSEAQARWIFQQIVFALE